MRERVEGQYRGVSVDGLVLFMYDSVIEKSFSL